MKKELSVFLALALLLSNSSLVSARPTPNNHYPDSDGGGVPIVNPVSVLVAYDEEMATNLHWWKDRWVSAKTYVTYQLQRAFFYFPFKIEIKGYAEWDSDDSIYSMREALNEVITELHWVPCVFYHILFAFTGQDRDIAGGTYPFEYASILLKQDWVPDDNAARHELGHIFRLDHCHEHCVMSLGGQNWWSYDELLRPIELGYVTIQFWGAWEAYAYMAYEWCSYHWEQLKDYFPLRIVDMEESTFIPENLKWEPYQTSLPKWNSPPFIMPYILVAIGIILCASLVIIVYLHKKRKH